jgi:hypothetical protein
LFVGWDWGGTAHDVTVIDSAGARVHRMAIAHTEDGIARAVARLADYGDPAGLPAAIETTRGPDKAPPQGPITYTYPDPHRSRWWYSPGVQPVGQDPRPARDRRPERVRDAKQPSRGEMCAATGFASVSSKMGATR